MKATTYVVLVTINHDDGTELDAKQIANQIQQGLEEGTTDHKSVIAATVDALPDHVAGSDDLSADEWKTICFHRDLRSNP